MKGVFLLSAVVVIAGCSATSQGLRSPTPEGALQNAPPAEVAAVLPMDAVALLTKSMTDSCSICVRDLRARAFHLLEEQYPPGVVVRSDATSGFLRAPGGANEWMLSSEVPGEPRLTFRFHTAEDHLVGIAASDMTDPSLAERCRSIPEGTVFQGALQIVAFAYGDGPTFLYYPSDNRVELHCRILEVSGF